MRLRLLVSLTAVLSSLLFAEQAFANHLHSRQVGNGDCVVLAPAGNERFVTLPAASFNNTTEPATTANPHPLHVHVHRGAPGAQGTIAVLGSAGDPCAATGSYLNYSP
jgi:hypothetical protein